MVLFIDNLHPRLWYEYFGSQLEAYKTKQILVMWGDDFAHKSSLAYEFLDQEINNFYEQLDHFKLHSGDQKEYKLVYSSMQKYFDAVYKEAEQENI